MTNHIDLDTIVLKKGGHDSPEVGLCLMEAVAYFAHEPHSASPQCASPVLTSFGIAWNDALDDVTRQRLKPYIPRLLGTRGTAGHEEIRAWMATDWLVRVQAPAWLRLAGLNDQAEILEGMVELSAETCPSILPALQAVRKDAAAAWAAAWAAARAAARDAAWAAAGAAAWAAARDAAWERLAPTVASLQESAFDLLDRMIAVYREPAKV